MSSLKYHSQKGEICFLGSISNILQYYNVILSESILLAESVGLDFRIKYDQKSFLDSLWLECVNFTGSDYAKINRLLSSRNYQLFSYAIKGEQQLYDFLFTNISNGIPIMVSLDLYNLTYHNLYKKIHFDHIVVIYGIEKQESEFKVHLSDCCPSIINSSYYEGYFTWRDFILMLSGKESYQVWCIDKEIFNKSSDSISLVYPICEHTLSYSGVSAIHQLSKLYNKLSRQTRLTDEMKVQLRRHYCLFTGFGGPVVTRKLFYSYLLEKNYKELAQECQKIIKTWNLISKNLMKASVLDYIEYISVFSKNLEEIAECEDVFIHKLPIEQQL